MHTEVFNNIDLLIEMSKTSFNIDDLNTELITLKKQIRNKRNEIEELKELMTDARYFNASNELVDKNIEISLKNKISHLNKKIRDISEIHEETKKEENRVHGEIALLKDKLAKNTHYIEVLTKKSETSNNNNYYAKLIEEENNNIKILNSSLNDKEKKYDNILKEIDLNNKAIEELNNKLNQEKNRLDDILDSLKNPNTYLNEELQNEDREKLKALESDLDKLEKRRVELLTDATMIGTDAKQLIADNNYMGALTKLKELITIIKSLPYMDINNMDIIREELDKKENERLELSNLIDNKKYEGLNSEAITDRISYVEEEINKNTNTINEYNNKINSIDEFLCNRLGHIINNIEKEINEKANMLDQYHVLYKDKDTSIRTKANLETAISKKEKEYNILNNILSSYKEDLMGYIAESNELNDIIKELEQKNIMYKNEIESLQKITSMDITSKDIIEEEKDKEELRNLNETIKILKSCEKYTKTPDEIYDEIEMALASLSSPLNEEIKREDESYISLDDLYIDRNDSNEQSDIKPNELLKVIDMIPVETVLNGGIQDGN